MARHAHASSVTVDVKIEGVQPGSEQCCGPGDDEGHASGDAEPFRGSPVVEIVCRDDGVGVNPSVTRRSGTANMAERARRHGGSFVIGPAGPLRRRATRHLLHLASALGRGRPGALSAPAPLSVAGSCLRRIRQLLRQPEARWPATQAATWVRRCSPILASREVMWFLTVFSATPSLSPISRLDSRHR